MNEFTSAIPDDVLDDLILGDLEPKQFRVQVRKTWYVAMEPSEAAVIAYRSEGARGVSFADGEMTGIKVLKGGDSVLVSQCLYRAVLREGGLRDVASDWVLPLDKLGRPDRDMLVHLETVRGWTSSEVDPVVKRLKLLGNLDQEETEEQLVKAIEKLQRTLEKVRAKKARKESDLKNSSGATTAPSV